MTDNLPAVIDEEDDFLDGLEDFGSGGAFPRISIVGDEKVFKDQNTGEEFTVITGIPIGMVRQRVMFPQGSNIQSGPPQCKSNDAAIGYPNMSGDEERGFPWAESGLNPNVMQKDDFGRVIIDCNACPLAKWQGTGAKAKKPRCIERHTYALLYMKGEGPENGEIDPERLDSAGLLSIQSSSMKASKNYGAAFKATKSPLYSSYLRLDLTLHKNGTVKYSTVNFKKLGLTDKADWPNYSAQYREVRDYLRRPPRPENEERTGTPEENAAAADSIEGQAFDTPKASAGYDDEIPF